MIISTCIEILNAKSKIYDDFNYNLNNASTLDWFNLVVIFLMKLLFRINKKKDALAFHEIIAL